MDLNKIYTEGTKRTFDNQWIRKRLKCSHRGCKNTILGIEGYNGMFQTNDEIVDLRNKEFVCDEHGSKKEKHMKLKDYVTKRKAELDTFQKEWEKEHAKDAETWPLEMEEGEWGQQELAEDF